MTVHFMILVGFSHNEKELFLFVEYFYSFT